MEPDDPIAPVRAQRLSRLVDELFRRCGASSHDVARL